PGECIVLRWNIQDIRSLRVNGLARTGEDSRELCVNNITPTFRVGFQDGSDEQFTLSVTHLYEIPVFLLLLVGAVASLSASAYLTFGPPGLLAALTILIGGPMIRSTVNLASNFVDHNKFAAIIQSGDLRALRPHFLYHALIIAINDAFPSINIE